MAWGQFTQRLRHSTRYVLPDRAFFDRVLNAARRCEAEVEPLSVFFRARRLPFDRAQRKTTYPSSEMGAPPPNLASSGRLNPEGIPCLYVADHEQTAISEIRPHKGAVVCVAPFRSSRALRIVDLLLGGALGRDDATIRCLSRMLAQPVHQDDALAYLGTQYLAETLKAEGFDGVRFESALREGGWNIALFDTESASAGDVRVFTVNVVSYAATEQSAAEAEVRGLFIPRVPA